MLHFESSISSRMRRTHLWHTFLWLHFPIAKYLIVLKQRMQCSLSDKSMLSEISDWIRGLAPYFADWGGCLYWTFYLDSTIILNVKSSYIFRKKNHSWPPTETFWFSDFWKRVLRKGRRLSWSKFLVWELYRDWLRKLTRVNTRFSTKLFTRMESWTYRWPTADILWSINRHRTNKYGYHHQLADHRDLNSKLIWTPGFRLGRRRIWPKSLNRSLTTTSWGMVWLKLA